MVELKNVSLVEAAPSNLVSDEECAALLEVTSTQCRRLAELADRVILLHNIDKQPSEIVDALAYHYHVDFYDASMPLDIRRNLVKNHNEWHRIKGTPAAVEKIIQIVFGDGYLVEWFEREGMEPYTFEVHTANAKAAAEEYSWFVSAVNAVKNVRSHMTRILVDESSEGEIFMGVAMAIHDKIILEVQE